MKKITLSASLVAIAMVSGAAYAKVSQQEASHLGQKLTIMGAEKAGNAAGTIPAYTGGLEKNSETDPFKDIFASEKPLFVITAKNVEKYKGNLSAGQLAMFQKHPDTYTMPIYKTHRTASFPDHVLDKAKKNATTSELLDGGNGLTNFDETVPFAIPKSALEVVWNHTTRFRGGNMVSNTASLPVERDGSYMAIKTRATLAMPQYLKSGYDAKKDKNILFYYATHTKAPSRLTGNVLLIHETIDQVDEPRKAWQYNAGQRRVRRAPQIGYDSPDADGLRTSDQIDMYNGSPDRYDWKLIGKKEMYIPYNSYKIIDQNANYDDIIGAGHINQDYTRYELHRVWHVQATIKDGSRHIYAKRDLYVDEDSWQIAIADHYDSRGSLWRLAEGHAMQFVSADAPWYSAYLYYDIISGRYMAELSNEERDPYVFALSMKRKQFTTSALRRSGKR